MKRQVVVPNFRPNPSHQDPRRAAPRHVTDVVTCPLGELLDLSGTGMRVKVGRGSALKPGQVLPIKLATPSGSVSVQVQVMWRKRRGWRGGAEAGLRFVGVTPGQSVALATIARFGFISKENVKLTQGIGAGCGTTGRGPDPPPDTSDLPAATPDASAHWYRTLGLKPGAPPADIKHAYRLLARQCHPDVAPGLENQQRFVELREAYDQLVRQVGRAG